MATDEQGLSSRLKEFKLHVWDHTEDPFQVQFDKPPELPESVRELTKSIPSWEGSTASDHELAASLRRGIQDSPDPEAAMQALVRLVGLTRNKVLSDLRAKGLKASSLKVVLKHDAVWAEFGPSLVRKLKEVLVPALVSHDPLTALSRATWPGWMRQERAKRQGHEAEHRLAVILKQLKIPFEPSAKADNPLCQDAQLSGISFDLVIPSVRNPRIVLKSTVHTANIGQYGESKDNLEVEQARKWLDEVASEPKPLLLALVDGVGFHSNAKGLEGVLSEADEFCQFKTLWKAVLLAASVTGVPVVLMLPPDEIAEHTAFLDRHNFGGLTVRPLGPSDTGIEAGEGLFLPNPPCSK